ncbi:Morphine 6-dehydrogenase [compost metagenome]
MLRWSIQRDIAVIPKSINPARMKNNMELFDFGLSDEEMQRISALDQNKRGFINPNNKLFYGLLA